MREHQRHVRRRDAADAAGLGKGDRTDAGELLAGLEPQVLDGAVIEGLGNLLVLEALLASYLQLLPLDVAGVFEVVSDLHG